VLCLIELIITDSAFVPKPPTDFARKCHSRDVSHAAATRQYLETRNTILRRSDTILGKSLMISRAVNLFGKTPNLFDQGTLKGRVIR